MADSLLRRKTAAGVPTPAQADKLRILGSGASGTYKFTALPVKVLHGIPNHWTYRAKLEAKWRRKGYAVRFAGGSRAS